MLVSESRDWVDQDNESADAATPDETQRLPKRRRGATAMEYLFVLSLIIVVAMTGRDGRRSWAGAGRTAPGAELSLSFPPGEKVERMNPCFRA